MFQVNTYLIYSPEGESDSIIVDPGMIYPEETERLMRFISEHRLRVTDIINTHLHLDHAFGNNAVAGAYGLTPRAAAADHPLGLGLGQQARMFGLPESLVSQPEGFGTLSDGEIIRLNGEEIRVIAVAGHSPGGIALYAPKSGWVITGDSLFNGSIGRTDLPGGDYQTLVRAVSDRLLTLPPQTVVYPGHGPSSTIGHEQTSNPYL